MKIKETAGNMVVAVLVDSSNKNTFEDTGPAMFSALNHLGIPYRIIDLGKKKPGMPGISESRGIIIAQEDIGGKISGEIEEKIIEGFKQGIGLVNFDPNLGNFPKALRGIWGKSFAPSKTDRIKIKNASHFITSAKEENELKELRKPVKLYRISGLIKPSDVLIEDTKKNPVLLLRKTGKANIAQFTVSPKLWLNEYFGHAEGLDDIFWKSIIWAVKKPFIMKAMPPFVTLRVDDCKGWNDFKWTKIANKYGYIPQCGLFLDQVIPSSIGNMKKLFKGKLAEFSPHAYGDYWEKKKVELIYLDHNPDKDLKKGGKEFSSKELGKRFADIDCRFGKWGIKMSKVLNPHYEEVGRNAMPFLRKRKMFYRMLSYLPGELFFGCHKDWKPAPYGNYGCFIDYLPGYQDFMAVSANKISNKDLKKTGKAGYVYANDILLDWDFLWKAAGNNPVDIETAVEIGVKTLKMGLDSMFMGLILTHEHKIEALSLKEWEYILKEINRRTSGYDKIYKSYDYIAEYARCQIETSISDIEHESKEKKIVCKLEGKSTLPLKLCLFSDKGRGVTQQFKEIPAFSGRITCRYTA